MVDRVGQQLGNYRLVSHLGEGGFAEVYLGEHIHLGTQAAIKVLHTRLTADDLEGFRNEARTIAHLEHPHIVRVLEFGIEAGIPFLVMSYAPNGSLRKLHSKGTPLPVLTIVSYVRQVADALQYAHDDKVIHRDVKPENMLVGRRHEVLLSDFGIALVAQSSRYQSTQEMAGTMAYMAPEQIQGHPRPASDQYSLGIVVYEWLSGDRPFHGSMTEIVAQHLAVPPPSLGEKLPTIPSAVEQVVMTALEKDPHRRFESVQAFANALEQVSQSARPTFGKPSPPMVELSPTIAASPPFGPPGTPVGASMTLAQPPEAVSAQPQREFPTVYTSQPFPQVNQTRGLTQVTQPKKGANIGLLVLLAVFLVAVLGSGIFYLTRGTPQGRTNPALSTSTPLSASTPATGLSPCLGLVSQLTDTSSAPNTVTFNSTPHHYDSAPPMTIDMKKVYCAGMNTNRGLIVLELDPQLAPNTVNNFVFLAQHHFYDGLVFHRVLQSGTGIHIIQTGDPLGKDPQMRGTGGPGYKFPDEPVKGDYTAGAVAMANAGPNTNGSQFFICTADDTSLSKSYNLFGHVVKGLDIAQLIQGPGDDPATRTIQPDIIDHLIVVAAP